jgi:CDP-6-deoxy-D-xylo-4-hexulose-3-dehydrase
MALMLPLATSSWDEEEYAAIQRVIASNRFTMGGEVSTFEREFANFFGSKYCVMSNSGSSANLLAVAALIHSNRHSLSHGDEVIVPAVSWSTTFYPLHQYGLKIKFVDIDPETLNLDLAQVEEAISPKTRVVLAVNLLGNPNHFDRLLDICDSNNLILMEDNCESMGAKFGGSYTGCFGLVGTFSSFFSHHISTMEGGMTVTDCEELYQLMVSLRAHGWTRGLPKTNHIAEMSNDSFMESFRFVLPGYNLRPLEISGAIGQSQLKKVKRIVGGRRLNAEVFKEKFSGIDGISIQKEVGESSWFGFSILIGNDSQRFDLVRKLERNGVEVRPIVAGNFVRNPVIKLMDYEISGSLKGADQVHENGLFFGNHHYDISEKLGAISVVVREHMEGDV